MAARPRRAAGDAARHPRRRASSARAPSTAADRLAPGAGSPPATRSPSTGLPTRRALPPTGRAARWPGGRADRRPSSPGSDPVRPRAGSRSAAACSATSSSNREGSSPRATPTRGRSAPCCPDRSTGSPICARSAPAARAGSRPRRCALVTQLRSSERCRRWSSAPRLEPGERACCGLTSTRPTSSCPATSPRLSRCSRWGAAGKRSRTTTLPLDPGLARRLRVGAERVLRANWRQGHRSSDGVPYAFTCPATPRYRHQWYWD